MYLLHKDINATRKKVAIPGIELGTYPDPYTTGSRIVIPVPFDASRNYATSRARHDLLHNNLLIVIRRLRTLRSHHTVYLFLFCNNLYLFLNTMFTEKDFF